MESDLSELGGFNLQEAAPSDGVAVVLRHLPWQLACSLSKLLAQLLKSLLKSTARLNSTAQLGSTNSVQQCQQTALH